MKDKPKVAVTSDVERERLIRLLETSPIMAMADELVAYRNKLIEGGFKKYEAFLLTAELQQDLLGSVFPRPLYSD